MRFELTTSPLQTVRCDLAALPVSAPGSLGGHAAVFDRGSGGRLQAFATDEGFTGARGQTVLVQSPEAPARRILLVGTGDAGTTEDLRQYAAVVVRRARDLRCGRVLLLTASDPAASGPAPDERVRAVAEGAGLGVYRFDRYRSEAGEPFPAEIAICCGEDRGGALSRALEVGEITVRAVSQARDLVNEPPNVLTPTALAIVAQEIADRDGLDCKVLDLDEARALGMGLFAAVAAGSNEPPRFIVLEYRPEAQRASGAPVPMVALVGKGITFDSGGLAIKSPDKMWRQKADMGGAAAIVAAIGALRALAAPVRVLGVIAAAENMISGSATRPGDIVRSLSGKTVEILNTDGEGRLVLADGLSYAARARPDVIIDVATLTAAAAAALGSRTAALMGTDQPLIDRLLRAAELGGEQLWQLPLYDEFRDAMRGDLADLKNTSFGSDGGGAEKAAAFLQQFVGATPWAHVDIGRAAFTVEPDALPYLSSGGTGYGVRTLLRYLAA
ncbi:MAG TPA: leucyl aminopeptidase [bacterium]|nr:leucyl aminopeptidase [bacterium]